MVPEADEEGASSVALAIPAHNEADGIGNFLSELDAAFSKWPGSVDVLVVDDASTDDTPAVLQQSQRKIRSNLRVFTNAENSGHGPTVLVAYQAALDCGAEWIIQVDGDGQFYPDDLVALLEHIHDDRDLVLGVRSKRQDPWFRRLLSVALRGYVRLLFGVSIADANCPLRLFRAPVLRALMNEIPSNALVPNIYLAVLCFRLDLNVLEVPVRHRVRLGTRTQGTTWGDRERKVLIPKRLMLLTLRAIRESLRLRTTLRRGPVGTDEIKDSSSVGLSRTET